MTFVRLTKKVYLFYGAGVSIERIAEMCGVSEERVQELIDYEEAIKSGEKIAAERSAKKCIELGLDIELISRVTGLSISEIEKL